MSNNDISMIQIGLLIVVVLGFGSFAWNSFSMKGKDSWVMPSLIIFGVAFVGLIICGNLESNPNFKPQINATKTQITRVDQQQIDINTQLESLNPKRSEYVQLLHQLINLDHHELQLTQKLNRLQLKQVKADDNQ